VFSNYVIIPEIEWMNNATVVYGHSTDTLYLMLHGVVFFNRNYELYSEDNTGATFYPAVN
jgi:hypothetical protein